MYSKRVSKNLRKRLRLPKHDNPRHVNWSLYQSGNRATEDAREINNESLIQRRVSELLLNDLQKIQDSYSGAARQWGKPKDWDGVEVREFGK